MVKFEPIPYHIKFEPISIPYQGQHYLLELEKSHDFWSLSKIINIVEEKYEELSFGTIFF